MAIDYLIGALIAASTIVNALALGAFWVTPGLRTTANRFVINLLIVNLVGCMTLTPSLFGGWSAVLNINGNDNNNNGDHHMNHNIYFERSLDDVGHRVGAVAALENIFNGTVRELIDLDADIEAFERAVDLVSEATVASSVLEAVDVLESMVAAAGAKDRTANERWAKNDATHDDDRNAEQRSTDDVFWGNTRHWGFDLTAALGKFPAMTSEIL